MKRSTNGDFSGGGPPAKRTPSVITIQRELQLERERHGRTQESVEQLRLEMQMMGRMLAAAREQIGSLGGESLSSEVSVQLQPAGLIPELARWPVQKQAEGHMWPRPSP